MRSPNLGPQSWISRSKCQNLIAAWPRSQPFWIWSILQICKSRWHLVSGDLYQPSRGIPFQVHMICSQNGWTSMEAWTWINFDSGRWWCPCCQGTKLSPHCLWTSPLSFCKQWMQSSCYLGNSPQIVGRCCLYASRKIVSASTMEGRIREANWIMSIKSPSTALGHDWSRFDLRYNEGASPPHDQASLLDLA